MQLNYKKIGEGKPLIILHGLFGQMDNWMTFAKKISISGLAVYLPDLRNHGHSPHSDVFNHKALADDVVELIKSNKLNDVILMGHSLGGKTVMLVALQHPELINTLVVVDIATKYYPVHHTEITDALQSVDFNRVRTRQDAEKILSERINDMGTRQFLLKNLYWKNDHQLDWRFNLKAIIENIEEVGKETTANNLFVKPAIFIRGEKSNYITDEDESGIKKLFPLANVITAPGAGHWVHVDAPQWLLEKLQLLLCQPS